jgi:hypothetical protein
MKANPIIAMANGIPPTATMKIASAIHGTATPIRASVSRRGRLRDRGSAVGP